MAAGQAGAFLTITLLTTYKRLPVYTYYGYTSQEGDDLQIVDVRTAAIVRVSESRFLTPSAFIFLYERSLFLTFRNRLVTVWNFRGEIATRFDDHVLWQPDSYNNSVYITATQAPPPHGPRPLSPTVPPTYSVLSTPLCRTIAPAYSVLTLTSTQDYLISYCLLTMQDYLISYCLLTMQDYLISYCLLTMQDYLISYCLLIMQDYLISYCRRPDRDSRPGGTINISCISRCSVHDTYIVSTW